VVDSWDGVLPRSLFFYLVDRGLATRSEIFDTFWPNLTTREATNVFHVTKRKISEVLGMDLTIYWSGFYHISPRIQLSYDVSLFTQMLQDSAVAPPQEAAALLREAIALFRGKFLTSLEMKWVVKRRLDLYQMYGDALISLGKIAENMGEQEQALGLYLQAAVTNPQREDVVQSIMTLYREMNMQADAIGVYQRLVNVLDDGLGVNPAPHLQELASAISAELRR
jgi:two-component SAPR family response regulator